jgi:hypothetical protein
VGISETIDAATRRLDAGEVDTATADLLRLQVEGRAFDADTASSFRDAMGRAISAAAEAASKGDARGQAALDMLRSARRP